jgi:primosomal protein N'
VTEGKLFGKIKIEVKEKSEKAKKFLVKTGRDKNGEEEILAQEALAKISSSNSPSAKTFIFVLSHGYADRIFCNDCKKSYDCENCEGAYSVLNEEEGRFLFCKNCKHKKILQDDQYLICKHCGSWRIFPFGIGGQKVKEFLEKEGVNNINLIDESQKKLSAKKIIEQVKDFIQTPGGLLVGSLRTLKVLQHINEKVDQSFVVSTGPIVRGKYFDSDEKLLKLISEIENISKEVYINKRDGDEISLENYKDKAKFIKEEIVFRKKHNLPPATKVLSLIFNYKNKRHVDKFVLQNISLFKPAGEIKKGRNFIYFWFVNRESEILQTREVLRQFGDVFLANTIVEQSVLGKK